MKLTWLGHACFLLEQDGYRIVVDPYTGVDGYPALKVEANAVYCSHGMERTHMDGLRNTMNLLLAYTLDI